MIMWLATIALSLRRPTASSNALVHAFTIIWDTA